MFFDGSQPKKTFSEKELLYGKVDELQCKAVELLCNFIHMDDYGSDGVDLKHAFDNMMKDTCEIPFDHFVNFPFDDFCVPRWGKCCYEHLHWCLYAN